MTEEYMKDAEFNELVEEFEEQENTYSNEGSRGVRNLESLIVAIDPNYKYDGIGTSTLHNFLEDNSGCIEAIKKWIVDMNNEMWKENLKSEIIIDDEESEEK